MPLIAGTVNKAAIAQVLEDLRHIVPAESLVDSERQLERSALKVADDDVNIVGIDETHFRRLTQEILWMIHDELIERRTRRYQNCHRRSAAPARSSHALPRRCNRPGISRKHRDIQAADIDSQFQSIRGYDATNAAIPQAPLDLPSFIRQVTSTITDDDIVQPWVDRFRSLLERSFQVIHQNLGHQAAVGENNRCHIPLQKRRRDMLRLLHVRSADAQLRIDNRRIVKEDVLLSFTGSALADEFKWQVRQLLSE